MHIRLNLLLLLPLASLYYMALFHLANFYWMLGKPNFVSFVAAVGYWWFFVPLKCAIRVILENVDEDEDEDEDEAEDEDGVEEDGWEWANETGWTDWERGINRRCIVV
ncbi:hypothetical protein DFH27DRAFT_528892 [Peziza echinospora]|nr:hypothetical protein DFH27DRAFT_528892 [Peziza echinospora]